MVHFSSMLRGTQGPEERDHVDDDEMMTTEQKER